MKAATHICVGIRNDTYREWFKEGDAISIRNGLWKLQMAGYARFTGCREAIIGYPFPETAEEIEIFYMLYPNIQIPTEEMISNVQRRKCA